MAYDSARHFNLFGQNTSTNTHRAIRNDIRVANNTMKPTSSWDNAGAMTSTNIYVLANGNVVGMIQSFTVNESRNITTLQCIGFEGPVCNLPGNTNGGTINVSRIALYESNMFGGLGLQTQGVPFNEIGSKTLKTTDPTDSVGWDIHTAHSDNLGYKTSSRLVFKSLIDQRVPLEIQTQIRREGSSDEFYTVSYIDCWLQSYSTSYTVQNIQVVEQCVISYADVY